MREEIQLAMKVALDRGENLEKIKTSFINAGYTKEDVQEAAAQLTSPYQISPERQVPSQSESIKTNQENSLPEPPIKGKPLPELPKLKKKTSKKKLIILIILLLIIFLGAIAYLVYTLIK